MIRCSIQPASLTDSRSCKYQVSHILDLGNPALSATVVLLLSAILDNNLGMLIDLMKVDAWHLERNFDEA